MKDKTDQIVDAAIQVFVNKGFIQATTQEIAQAANVAEVTLYRKFSTKQNLFEYVVSKVIEETFLEPLSLEHIKTDTKTFLTSILRNRLMIISQNKMLVRVLIAESIAGNLPKILNFPHFIFQNIENALKSHFKQFNQTVNASFLAQQIGSILLGYTILPTENVFHQLEAKSQEGLIDLHVTSLMTLINLLK